MSRPGPKKSLRWPIEPLEAVIGIGRGSSFAEIQERVQGRPSAKVVAEQAQVHVGVVSRWRREGLTTRAADEAAIAIGSHPAVIWPEFSSSPVGVDASLRGTGSVQADPDGSVAPVDAAPPVSRATDPQPESEGL